MLEEKIYKTVVYSKIYFIIRNDYNHIFLIYNLNGTKILVTEKYFEHKILQQQKSMHKASK